MKRLSHVIVAVLVLAAVFGRVAPAQQSSGSISGVVQDAQGAVVPGAKVTLVNQGQGAVARELQTTTEGYFFFTPVIPGTYTVTVEASGFKKYAKTDITLYAQDRVGLPPIMLEIGAVGESINVEAAAVALQTVSAERSGVLTGRQMTDLGSSTRLYTDLLPTVPGFNADTTNANGLRTDQNAIAVDGTLVEDVGNNSAGGWRLNMDIIAEFKVLTNGQQAEFGRASASNITLVTKSGSRDFHGVGYYFYRNEWMNSNTWMNNYNGLSRPRNRNSTFGFSLGGPVYIPHKLNSAKEKLFFFTNWEFQRPRVIDNLVSLTVPTALERQGDFSQTRQNNIPVTILDPANNKAPFPGNLIPQSRWNQYGLQLMNVFPLPNRLGVDPGYNYQYQFVGSDSRNDDTVRIDYNISSRLKFFFRWLQNRETLIQSGGLNVNNTIGVGSFQSLRGTISGAGNLTFIITPTLTNEFNYGNTRNWLPNTPTANSGYTRAKTGVTLPLLYPNADSQANLIPNMFFGSEVTNAPTVFIGGMPYDNENPTANITDNVAKVFSTHTLKAGIYIETSTKRQTATEVNNGRLYFNTDSANPGDTGWDFSNMLLGNYQTFDQSNTYLKGYYYYRTYEWYAQDNWKVRPNLTFDYGMRFSILQPWYELHDQISSFQPAAFAAKQEVTLYQPTLVNGVRSSINPLTGQTGPAALIGAIVPNSGNVYNGIITPATSTNGRGMVDSQGVLFGPRFGLAWTPLGASSNLVVRLGGGVFYERLQGNMIFNQINYPPELLTPKIYYGNLSTIASSAGTLFPLNVAGLSPEGKIPTVYNYNFTVERLLPGQILLDVGYVGMQNRHELTRTPFNEPAFGTAWLAQNQDPTRCPTISTCNLNGVNALPIDFLRPYVGFSGNGAAVAQSGLGGGGFIATYGASANYNALQISAQRRMSHLSLGSAFTWSKVMGTDSDYSFVGNYLNHRAADYAPLTFDRTLTMVVNWVYDIPNVARKGSFLDNPVARGVLGDWQVSGIASFSSGEPVVIGGNSVISLGSYNVQGLGSATLNQEMTGNADWAARPFITCDPNRSRGDRTLYAYINTSCFAPAAAGSTGMDSYLRPVRGPGINNFNISLFKKVPLGRNEQRYLQFRIETYNTLNHTQWGGAVSNNYEAAGFNNTPTFNAAGQITNLPTALGGGGGRFGFGALNATRSPRTVQLGAKIYF
ncbi:MAG TPA: carboxypeptidase regulatory-like domain-containing protein [Bryobacteraceae bacterium]|nr:carboxypeptidase regulatory-like domain-containing protein [Bryobacteraceae bacterium]